MECESHERGRKPLLSDRRQKVLQALIEEYIANAQPVGSRTLVDRYRLGVSSATVRNELSVLEDEGYLTSPHTSAGRVPTDAGYRAFVDDLLSREYGEDATGGMFDNVRDAATKMDDLMEQTSAALSRLDRLPFGCGRAFFARVFGEANFARVHVVSSHAHGRRYR